MRLRGWGVAGGVLVWLCVSASAAPLAQTAQTIARELQLQQVLPGPPVPEGTTKEPAWSFHLPLGDMFVILGFIIVAVGLGYALWTVRDRLPVFGNRTLRADPDSNGLASVEKMIASQLEADELAGNGQLTEAMHTLLLRSLIEMRKTLGIGIPDSLTSREIVRRVSLPEIGRQALADIVGRVELVYFGDRQADQSNYAACRASYVSLIAAIRADLRGSAHA